MQTKYNKIKSIIESCKTYDQISTCFVFVESDSFFTELEVKFDVLSLIQKKLYYLRNLDIKEHRDFIKDFLTK